MRVVGLGRLARGTGQVVPAEVLDARAQAAALIAAARAEAEATRASADGVRAAAERRGREEGFAAGREAGHAEVTELLVAARRDAAALRQIAAEAALPLARKMAERIVGRALEVSPELAADVLAATLAEAGAADGPLVLRAHPEDLKALAARGPAWLAAIAGAANVTVEADPGLRRGGCVVDTPAGRVDARLDAQLDAMERALRTAGRGAAR